MAPRSVNNVTPATLTPADRVEVREIRPDDAVETAKLTGELGYPASSDEMRARIEDLIRLTDHAIFVACLAERVVAWIHVMETRHLQSGTRAEIGGLVVSEDVRSSGIGRRLIAHAEGWARQRRLTTLVVRSNVAREKAHRFYMREGYQQTKTSAVFTKQL